MFGLMPWAKYRLKLGKLQTSRQKTLKAFQEDMKKTPPMDAVPFKSPVEYRAEVRSQMNFEVGMLDDEIEILRSTYLLQRAGKRFLEVPSREEPGMWEEAHQFGVHHLSRKGMAKVVADLHADGKATREAVLAWVTPSIGFIGALIGLVAAFKK